MTTSEAAKTAGDWRGADLGTRTVSYTERDAILYALAVGAKRPSWTSSSRISFGYCRPLL